MQIDGMQQQNRMQIDDMRQQNGMQTDDMQQQNRMQIDDMRQQNRMQTDGMRQYEFVKCFNYIREAGTEGERRAAEQIVQEVRRAQKEEPESAEQIQKRAEGLEEHMQKAATDTGSVSQNPPETVRMEEFVFPDYRMEEVCFRVCAPYQKEYRVTGYLNCGSTPGEGITAPFLYVENGDEVSLAAASGAIVLVNTPVRKELYQKLVDAHAAGFLSVCGTPLDTGADRIPRQYKLNVSGEKPIQGAAIHYLDAVELTERGASACQLTVRQTAVVKQSQNIAVRIDGTDLREEILTLTAHYDSVPDGPGAYDNMSGAAIVMEAYRYFLKHRPRRTIECVWFGAEEKGLRGSLAYAEQHEEKLSGHIFNMNVDLAGQLIGGNVLGVTAGRDVCASFGRLMHEKGIGVTIKNQVWSSDSNVFAWKGIPSMTLNRDGFGMHTRYDTIDQISPWSLQRSAHILCTLADWMANVETLPFKREIPEDMRAELERSFR